MDPIPEDSCRTRVGLIVPFEVFGAAEDYAFVLARGLRDRGWEVRILCPESLPARLPIHTQKELRECLMPLPSRVLESPPRLFHVLRHLRLDLVHINQEFLPALAAGRLVQAHLVVTTHTPVLKIRYSIRGRILYRFGVPEVQRWIVLSERNRVLVEERRSIRPERIRVVNPGLPEGRLARTSREDARARLGIPPDIPLIGTVGRLAPQKRIDLLLAAARRLPEDVHVLVLGDGPLAPMLREQANQFLPGRVHFLGYRHDVPLLLPGLDLFCLSSDFEGLPFALLEAMGSGLPVVATDVQGSGEAVVHGESGILVSPGRADQLTDALARLLLAPEEARRLGAAARARFLRMFTADTMIARTEAVYRELLQAA